QMYAAGVAAGRPVATVATRWARAAALAGDLDAALRIADRVVTAQESPDRADGARTAAAALAHRGQLAHSAELYRWSGPGWAASFAAIGLIGTGDLTTGADLLDGPVPDGPPTLYAGAAALMVRGEPAEARRQLSAACPRGVTLEPRDWLFAVALDLGLARRDNDPARLHSTWSQAGEAILRHPIDLFMLLPLGEFTICAARLG